MKIHVLLFASLAQQVGKRDFDLVLPEPATVFQALDALEAQHAAVARIRRQLAVAVNQEYVPSNHPLSDGDELALIPPVSGG